MPQETLQDVGNNGLIQLSRDLLDAVVKTTNILHQDKMTPEKLQEAKVVLGFLSACNTVMQTKMRYFKMTGLGDKVQAVKEKSKKI